MAVAKPTPSAGMAQWTLVLLLVSTAATELMLWTPAERWLQAIELLAVVGVVGLAWWQFCRGPGARPRPTGWEQAWLAVLLLLPIGCTALRHILLGSGGWLLELLLLAGLRNLAWGLLATRWEQRLRLAAAVSLPLVLTSTLLCEHRSAPVVAGLYVLAGCGWLTQFYWQNLPVRDETPRRPSWTLVALLLLMAGALSAALSVDAPITRSLWGFLPSSGGTRWFDPASRGGVNSGDDEARGAQTAQSVGFSESDQYLDTEEPSLYDVVGELYGKPRKMTAVERAVALPLEKARRREIIPAENLRPGREFQLLREPSPTDRPESRGADALLYVQGPAPAHLALVAYDWFDGVAWKEEPYAPLAMCLKNKPDDPWMEFIYPQTEKPAYFMLPVRHTIKIAKLKGAHLPTPAHLTGFRVGKLNVPNFFAWAQPGIVRLADRDVPKATIFETQVDSVDRETLARRLHAPASAINKNYLALPGDAAAQGLLDATADAWTRQLPSGWPQIEAVLTKLRTEFTLDPRWHDPAQTTDVVGHFLTHSRRGRDFHFASAAVLLLRTLGYPTRLVSGFYVNPERWNEQTGHYHLMREEVHFWPELLVDGKYWVPLEPTPGFDLMPPRLTWLAWLLRRTEAAWEWCCHHPWLLTSLAVGGVLLYALRRTLLNGILTLRWRWSPRSDARRRVQATLRILEQRGAWSGMPRPPGTPVQRWYPGLAAELKADPATPLTFSRLVNWALYAPDGLPTAASPAEADHVCQAMISVYSLRRLRQAARSRRSHFPSTSWSEPGRERFPKA